MYHRSLYCRCTGCGANLPVVEYSGPEWSLRLRLARCVRGRGYHDDRDRSAGQYLRVFTSGESPYVACSYPSALGNCATRDANSDPNDDGSEHRNGHRISDDDPDASPADRNQPDPANGNDHDQYHRAPDHCSDDDGHGQRNDAGDDDAEPDSHGYGDEYGTVAVAQLFAARGEVVKLDERGGCVPLPRVLFVLAAKEWQGTAAPP